jgi:hypothetical protein
MSNKRRNILITFFTGTLITGFIIGGIWIYQNWLEKDLKELPSETEIKKDNTGKIKSPTRESTESTISEDTNADELPGETTEPGSFTTENEPGEIENIEKTAEPQNLGPVYISQSRSLFGSSDLSIDNLPAGKAYFLGENGKLESIVNKESNGISEQLVSYDYYGQKVDILEIGLIDDTGQVVKYAVFSQNKIAVFETVKTKKKEETKVTEYAITPRLNFIKGKTYAKLI